MEEKKASEYTKDEIFNMSDEEFEKNFHSLNVQGNEAFNGFFEPSERDVKDKEGDNKDVDSGTEEEEGDNNQQDVKEVDGGSTDSTIDKQKNIWNNFNSVNQDETPAKEAEAQESSDDNTQVLDVKDVVDEPSNGEEPKQQPQIHKVKAYGQTMNFTTEELIKLAPKALHFTKKLQELAPYRRSISAMQENNITESDINQFIEMRKGNKTAIANFLSKNNIDAYDVANVDDYSGYQPNQYGREQNALTRIADELSMHPRIGELQRYVDTLDSESKSRLAKNPDVLEVLMSNIENGYFDVIAPEANKRAFLGGNSKPMIEYYAEVAQEYYNYLDSQQNKEKQKTYSKDINSARSKAKITGDTGTKTQQKKPKEIRSAYDISEEELKAFEKQMGFL